MINNELITFGAITKEEARQLMKAGKKVCYWGRKQDNCAKIVKVNPAFAVLDNRYKVRYKALTPEDKYIPHAEYIKKPSYQSKRKKFVGTTPDYEKSRATKIKPIPQSKLSPIHTRVKRMGKCLDDMREIKKKCTLSQAMCKTGFTKGRECVEKNAQEITDKLNDHYKLPMNTVVMKGTRPKTSRGGDLYGDYTYPSGKIRVFPYTKGRLNKETGKRVNQQVVANKTGLETLIHEWNHHYDHRAIGLKKSPHTAGFGIRTSTIHKQLKSVFD